MPDAPEQPETPAAPLPPQALNRRRLEWQPLWWSDPKTYELVTGILFRHDPIRICIPENPKRETEYITEVNTILPRLKDAATVEGVQQIVYEEFVRWFSERAAGPRARYRPIAQEIWEAMQAPE